MIGGVLSETPLAALVRVLPKRGRREVFTATLGQLMGTSAGTRATKAKWIPIAAKNPTYLAAGRAWLSDADPDLLRDPTGCAMGIVAVLLKEGSRRSLDALEPWITILSERRGHGFVVMRELVRRHAPKSPLVKRSYGRIGVGDGVRGDRRGAGARRDAAAICSLSALCASSSRVRAQLKSGGVVLGSDGCVVPSSIYVHSTSGSGTAEMWQKRRRRSIDASELAAAR